MEVVSVADFLKKAETCLVLDVRSPSEFSHAHIPGAYSLPLFTDEERKIVGTAYKQKSKELAIKIGLDYFGPKMRTMVEDVEQICASKGLKKTILIHCWRGGMRSRAVAWLLDLYGFEVYMLHGGYKGFRTWILAQFEKQYHVKVIGGYTGSGKTSILHQLEKRGESIIDLEFIAQHKGSSFGHIGLPDQPSQEMFENILGTQLYIKSLTNGTDNYIWIEDESQRLGHVFIPTTFWETMRQSNVYFLDIPFDQRLDFIIQEYGGLDKEQLAAAILRIQKRLGGLETNNAIVFLHNGQIKACFDILLKYYDRFYLKCLEKKSGSEKQIRYISCDQVDSMQNAKTLLIKCAV